MEITQLTYFKTVAKYESFTKAAMELHITQSALSRSIAQLESEIGVLLFERKKGGKITLNNDGRFFLQHVIQMLNGLDNTVAAVKERAGLERGVIHQWVSDRDWRLTEYALPGCRVALCAIEPGPAEIQLPELWKLLS